MSTVHVYIRPGGSNLNDGLSDTDGGAKRTFNDDGQPGAQSVIVENDGNNYVIHANGNFDVNNGAALNFLKGTTSGQKFTLIVDEPYKFTALTRAAAAAAAYASALTMNSAGSPWTIVDLALYSTSNVGFITANDSFDIVNMLIAGEDADGDNGLVTTASGINVRGFNVVMVGVSNTGFTALVGAVRCWFCTAIAPSGISGVFRQIADTLESWGCLGQGPGTQFAGTDGGDYNVSEDATAPGAHSVPSQSGVVVSTTSGSEDAALSGAVAVNIVDRTGMPSYTDYDIWGNPRPMTGADAGAVQTVSTTTDLPHEDTAARTTDVADIDGDTGSDGKVEWEKTDGAGAVSIEADDDVFLGAASATCYRDVGQTVVNDYRVELLLETSPGADGFSVLHSVQADGSCILFKGRSSTSLAYKRTAPSTYDLLATLPGVAAGQKLSIQRIGDDFVFGVDDDDLDSATVASFPTGPGGIFADAVESASHYSAYVVAPPASGIFAIVSGLVRGLFQRVGVIR